jgi:hypothetical protein
MEIVRKIIEIRDIFSKVKILMYEKTGHDFIIEETNNHGLKNIVTLAFLWRASSQIRLHTHA